MTNAPGHDAAHLANLIVAARDEAVRVGGAGGPVVSALDAALAAARAQAGPTGGPNEGLRVDELTTENDK
jgi:1,6-anhydro-N-acetylmuramate kinase